MSIGDTALYRIFIEQYERPVVIWTFDDAPVEYCNLSEHGGDEDYVALFPAEVEGYGGWLLDTIREGSWFAPCCIEEYTLPNGDVVRIGAHA